VRKIPFTIQIPKEQRDKALEEKLLEELPGILAWAVQGCLDWQHHKDLKEPQAVVTATQAYRTEMDSVARFLDDCCVIGPVDVAKVKAITLASAYRVWCKRTGEEELSNNALIATLERRGIRRNRGKANQYYWYGVGLASTDDERYG